MLEFRLKADLWIGIFCVKTGSMDQDRSWLLLTQATGRGTDIDLSGTQLLNLAAIRSVEVVSATELNLRFSVDHVVNVHDLLATQILKYLLDHAIYPSGKPFTTESPVLNATEGLPLEA